MKNENKNKPPNDKLKKDKNEILFLKRSCLICFDLLKKMGHFFKLIIMEPFSTTLRLPSSFLLSFWCPSFRCRYKLGAIQTFKETRRMKIPWTWKRIYTVVAHHIRSLRGGGPVDSGWLIYTNMYRYVQSPL